MIRRLVVIAAALLASPLLAQESGKITDLQFNITDLQFNVTDLSGKPVEIAGAVQDMQVQETATEMRIDLAADVLFDFDKSDILPKAQETLTKAAALIKEKAKGAVRVEGHTDAKGGEAYNLRLSERRAASVANWFRTAGGLANVKFETRGLGAKQPVAPNTKPDGSDDPEGRQKNRRVEIVATK